jgi:hypothetical protein
LRITQFSFFVLLLATLCARAETQTIYQSEDGQFVAIAERVKIESNWKLLPVGNEDQPQSERRPAATAAAPSEPGWFNIKNYGAYCDGVTDDTVAVAAAINAAVVSLNSTGSAILHFPASSGVCKTNGFTIPQHAHWLYVLFENSLKLTGEVVPAPNTAFVGFTGSTEGLEGTSLHGPKATWSARGLSVPMVNMTGGAGGVSMYGLYFSGIGFVEDGTPTQPLWLFSEVGGIGAGNVHCIDCTFSLDGSTSSQPLIAWIPSSPLNTTGYSYFFDFCSFDSNAIAPYAIFAQNAGAVTIQNSSIGGAHGFYFKTTNGFNSVTRILDNITEGLTDTSLVTYETAMVNGYPGTSSSVFIDRNTLADDVGNVYLLKTIGPGNIVQVEITPLVSVGSGAIDPQSTGTITGLECHGAFCDSLPNLKPGFGNTVAGYNSFPTDARPVYFDNSGVPGAPYPALDLGSGLATPFKTVDADYTLTHGDYWVNVTGWSKITVPHAPGYFHQNVWHVFNSGDGTVSVYCDSGTINGRPVIGLRPNSGASVTSDGKNCFADVGYILVH